MLVVGGGRMGEAIVAGLIGSNSMSADRITVAEPDGDRCQVLSGRYGVACVPDAITALSKVDTLVLAVKPQVIVDVVEALASALGEGTLVVSIAAGITCAKLEALLPAGTPVVRVMPNTPAMVGEGMSVISSGSFATPAHVDAVRGVFDTLGKAVVLDERHQNAATAISGSGPAYVALFIDALTAAGASEGLPADVAAELAIQTARGTTLLLERTGQTPEELVRAVSSPGGTTVAATAELEIGGFRETLSRAVSAAVRRAEELGA